MTSRKTTLAAAVALTAAATTLLVPVRRAGRPPAPTCPPTRW